MHMHAHTRACAHTRTAAAVQVIAIRWVGRPTVTARSAGANVGRCSLK